jgi:hypothetical protein
MEGVSINHIRNLCSFSRLRVWDTPDDQIVVSIPIRISQPGNTVTNITERRADHFHSFPGIQVIQHNVMDILLLGETKENINHIPIVSSHRRKSNSKIIITNFQLFYDVIDLSAISGLHTMNDLDYSTPPLTIHLPNQTIQFLNCDDWEFTERNFLFSVTSIGNNADESDRSQSSPFGGVFSSDVVFALMVLVGCFLATLIYARYFSPSYSSLDSSFSSVAYKRKLRKLSTQVAPFPLGLRDGKGNDRDTWSVVGTHRRAYHKIRALAFDFPLSEEESNEESDKTNSIIPQGNDDSESEIDYDQILSSDSFSSCSSLEDETDEVSPYPSDHSSSITSAQYSHPIGEMLSTSDPDGDEDDDVIRGADNDSSSSSSFSSLNDSFMGEYEEYSSEKQQWDQENDKEKEGEDLLSQDLELPQLFSDLV